CPYRRKPMSEDPGIDRHAGIDRRSLFDAISRVSLGLAATAVIADQVKAAPSEETKADELEPFKYDIESEKGWVGPGGSAKEATGKKLRVSPTVAAVRMTMRTA